MFFKTTLFGIDFVFFQLNSITMKSEYSLKDKLILLSLAVGVGCFGFIFPDSLSDHDKFVHFSAHFGMSFLLAFCFYLICSVKMRVTKTFTYTVLISATLFIGILYKYWEIATYGMIGNYSFLRIIDNTGLVTSMSQNLSGLLGAILLIEGFVDKNLVVDIRRNALQTTNRLPSTSEH
jgi:glucan phosphoethanolaminetransferase (alkaline phosphatase superfamily)